MTDDEIRAEALRNAVALAVIARAPDSERILENSKKFALFLKPGNDSSAGSAKAKAKAKAKASAARQK
jgi:hypothetical protein